MKIKLSEIKAATPRVRKELNLDKMDELAESIKETGGVIVPVKLRKNGEGYTTVYGHRRIEACRMAGLDEIEAFIEDMDDSVLLTQALIENVVREDMQPIDIAKTLQQIRLENEWTLDQTGSMFGMSAAVVSAYLKMLLPEIEKAIHSSELSYTHIREARAGTEDDADAVKVIEKAAKEGLTQRQVRTVAEEYKQTKKDYGPKAANQVLKTPFSELGLKQYIPTTKPDRRTRTPQEIKPKKIVFQWVKDNNIIRAGNLLGRMASSIEDLSAIVEYMIVNADKEPRQLLAVKKSMIAHVEKRMNELAGLQKKLKEM